MKVKIVSCGGYLPSKCVTNAELALKVDTNDEWIRERTGITQRFLVSDGENTSDIATKACLEAMGAKKQVDALILATTTPDLAFPSTACLVQKKLSEHGINVGFAFDIQAVCAGFVYAFSLACSMIKSGQISSAVVCGADTLSKILDWNDRTTCVLFGDGAGAVLLEKCEGASSEVLYSKLYSDGTLSGILKTEQNSIGGHYITMQGKEVFRHAVTKMVSSIQELCSSSGISINDIKKFFVHQANERILDAVCDRLALDPARFVKTIQIHANTSAASIPLAIKEDWKNINRGDLVILEALGGGLTWGGVLLRF